MTRIGQNLNRKLYGLTHNIIVNYNAVNAEHRENLYFSCIIAV